MPFFFQSCDEEYVYYMGKDQYENDELIRYMFPEDIWFHVENFSSAHVYLRHVADGRGFPVEVDPHLIPPEVLEECLQLTKANSIDGCKPPTCSVCWTLQSNLHKTGDMAPGQVGYHNRKEVYRQTVTKDNVIVKRVMKRKTEVQINLQETRAERDRQLIRREKERKAEQDLKEKERREAERLAKQQQEYAGFMNEEDMKSNTENQGKSMNQFIDDFWG
ncbi:putative coiled-coil protein [Blattamonas nauphoetae]|uniref:Coiled-coil protein n=1 Tax=Blattamonas nauphoetae TaxID=2049346 RepID=A0ABQ9X7R4_9EUKA|nr:putative coiled-coil protein [Blattamonas nauphoetae]